MPMRFSTEAANADVMGEDPQPGAVPPRKPRGRVRNPAPGARSAGADPELGKEREQDTEARPGDDINAAGFVKDEDAAKP